MQKKMTQWTAVFLLLGGLTFLGGCGTPSTTVHPENQKETAAADQKSGKTASQAAGQTLYRAGKDGKLKAQTVKLTGDKDKLPLAVLKELVEKQPQGDTTFPKGLKVNQVTVKDKVATVDFSREFQTRRGDHDTLLMLYAVVDTLTEFPEIQSVKFTVKGKPVTVLGGQDLSVPLQRDKKYIQ